MITWREAALESRIPGDGLSVERNHHPPAEQERSLADRIDIDDEDRDGVSMCSRKRRIPSICPNTAAASFSTVVVIFFTFFVLPFY